MLGGSAEGKLLMLDSAHILCRTPPHKCGFLLITVLLLDLTQNNSSLPVTKYTVTVCQAILVAFFESIHFLNYRLTMFWPAI